MKFNHSKINYVVGWRALPSSVSMSKNLSQKKKTAIINYYPLLSCWF